MTYTPEYLLNGNVWLPNTQKVQLDGNPLFICNGSKIAIFHGDSFWTFPDDKRTCGNRMVANNKWVYDDAKPRFKTKEEIQDAINVYNWLNS